MADEHIMVVLDSKDVSPRQGIQQAKSLYLRLLFDISWPCFGGGGWGEGLF